MKKWRTPAITRPKYAIEDIGIDLLLKGSSKRVKLKYAAIIDRNKYKLKSRRHEVDDAL